MAKHKKSREKDACEAQEVAFGIILFQKATSISKNNPLFNSFSENDTFRSNQIREGMLTREQAMALIEEDNLPRYETLRWYLEIIGLDFAEVVKVVNKIPKLYSV